MSEKRQNELCFMPAVELAARVYAKEVSPVEIVDAFLACIDAVNPKLNAYVTILHDKARHRAKELETDAQRGEFTGPLHGVPVSIKDLTFTKGVRTTSGSRVFKDRVPDEDAPVVERLLGAGAINLGKTNTPEFGWLAITDNTLFGRTNNPWNAAYTPSGSSGGAAAAVAAGLCPIAHGSDGGGSIRHPAAYCGVFGMKPTFGMIPRHTGVDGWPTLSHHGPLTWTVGDAALALDVMCGYDSRDRDSAPLPPQEFLKNLDRDLTGLRVAWSTDLGFAEVDSEVRDIFEEAAPVFEQLGCILKGGAPDIQDSREIFKGVMFAEGAANYNKHIREDGSSDMDPALVQFTIKRRDILARDYLGALEQRTKLYRRVHTFFEEVDLFVTPTMAIPPFKHPSDLSEYPHEVNGKEVGSTGWHPFTYPFNLTGQPAASIPCGFTRDGLPVGLQIVGRRFEDLLVMQAARRFEEARHWHSRRPPID